MLARPVELSLPPRHWFKLPQHLPLTVQPPPPTDEFDWRSPLNIDPDTYNQLLDFKVPATIALGYLTFVLFFNQINRNRGFKPFSISKTRVFYLFTLIHNIGLAIFSGVTCFALCRAIAVSVPNPFGPDGAAATVDALCRIHGPRGYGDAVYFNAEKAVWSTKNQAIKLGAGGLLPDSTDVGRIWNEGLAWWGWVFYLSKFYEVIDTLIILAKGKRSSTLQTYHHAGAMLCMWAGIRYMSPPIWMFVCVNSGVHLLMYTYYTLTTLGVSISKTVKGSITTIQITQFIVGASYAATHLFVSYVVPVATPYSIASAIQSARSSASSAAASVDAQSFFKKLAYRAAGAEGLAERVENRFSHGFSHGFELGASTPSVTDRVLYRKRFETSHCLDTSGEAFAIWLNVIYLMPLTILFLRFFVKTYIFRTTTKTTTTEVSRQITETTKSAFEETKETVEEFGTKLEKSVSDMAEEIETGGKDLNLEEVVEKAKGNESTGAQLHDELETSHTQESSDIVQSGHRSTEEDHASLVNGEDVTEIKVESSGPYSSSTSMSSTSTSTTTTTLSKTSSRRSNKESMMEGDWMRRKTPIDSDEQVDFQSRVSMSTNGHVETTAMPNTPKAQFEDLFDPDSPDGGFGLNG